jgi:hypothetical protein
MKTSLPLLSITAATLLSAATAEASPHWSYTIDCLAYRASVCCIPVYSHTVELGRECFYQSETDYCDCTYRHPVVVVT